MTNPLHDSLADIFGVPATSPAPTKPANPAAAGIARVKEILSRPTAPAPTTAVTLNTDPSQVKYHKDVIQGSDEWLALRCGKLTASEMKLIITPTLKIADNDKTRAHVYEIAAQRITGYVEPHYISDDMLRGQEDEIDARLAYIHNYAPVKEVGFVTNDSLGFPIGYSPDGLVGDVGAIECKSRRMKYQIQMLVEHVFTDTIPDEYMLQIQTGLWVAGLEWIDFISYCGGLEMCVVRCYPDAKIQEAIKTGATAFEEKVQAVVAKYCDVQKSPARLVPTERRVEQEISL